MANGNVAESESSLIPSPVTPEIWKTEWVDTVEALKAAVDEMTTEEVVAIDTETVGWQTGNEQLCLAQFGLPQQSKVFLIDTLAIPEVSLLSPVLLQEKPLLVAHNAAFEMRQFERYGLKLKGVVDTLKMARKLRPDLPNHTLQTCARHVLGFEISKTEQTSDWSLRPLSFSQRDYAKLDAVIAYHLYLVLKKMEDDLQVNAADGVPELMRSMAETVARRLELVKEISAELALLNAREEKIREVIKGRLISGDAPYEGPYGYAKVARIKRTEVSPAKVRERFPEIAPLVISEMVKRERIKDVMGEYGISEKRLEEVLDIIGYADRLTLKIKEKGATASAGAAEDLEDSE